MSKLEQRKFKNHKVTGMVFAFFLSIFLMTSGGHTDPVDGPVYFLITENIVKNGQLSLTVNTETDEKFGIDVEKIIEIQSWGAAYAKASQEVARGSEDILSPEKINERRERIKEITAQTDYENYVGPAYVILPVVSAPLFAVAHTTGISEISFVSLFLNSSIIAGICVTVFLIGKELFKSEKIGFILAIICGISSFLWPYITTMFANPIGLLFMTLSLLFVIKSTNHLKYSFFAGLFLGLTVIAHPLFQIQIIGIFIFGIYKFRKTKKSLVLFLIAISAMALLQGGINEHRFGSMFDFGTMMDYSGRADRTLNEVGIKGIFGIFDNLGGIFFSPGYSIYLYLPIFLLTPIGWYYMFKKERSLTILLIYLTAIMFVYVGTGPGWNENPYWGTHRYLIGIIPAAIIPIGALLSLNNFKIKISIVILTSIGFFTNLLGNLTWIQYSYSYGWGPEGLWKFEDIPAIFTWNPFYSPIMQSMKVISSGWVGTLNQNSDSMDYFRIGLNGCNYDIFLYCEFGIGIMAIVGTIVGILGIFLVKKLDQNQKVLRNTNA